MHKDLKSPALLIALSMLSFSALAANGGCPAGKEGKQPKTPLTKQVGDLDVHLESEMDLGLEAINSPGWQFRARTVTIGAGTVIPLHSHNERPETVMMKHGGLTIYELDCTVGYTMQEGEVYQSGHGKQHWAVNETDHPVVMYVTDLLTKDNFPVGSK
ncbi:cupin domain-containing protein [Pseudomonas sp. NPDC078700]|uniref:cupin domain-containing protein n=1 Tax=Pseudomonas sp. NPDC078700 TaxID=3364424 RepID=UPI0037CB69D4